MLPPKPEPRPMKTRKATGGRSARRAVALALCLAGEALAQSEAGEIPVVELPPVRVTSTPVVESAPGVTRFEVAAEPLIAQTTATFSDRTANLYIGTGDARSFTDTFALRGLTNTPIFGPPAVTFYLDELPLANSFTLPTDLVGFARGELHRGPTANTIHGRAGPAGVMAFATPEPADRATGELRGSVGSYEARNVNVQQQSASGGPADVYVSAAYAARDGYVENLRLGRDVDFKESISGLTRIRIRPTNPLELTLLATAQRANDGAQPLVPLGGPLFTVTRESEGETNLAAVNVALTAAVATGIGRLSATSSYSEWGLEPYSSVLAFGPQELTNEVMQCQSAFNEELKLTSKAEAVVRWNLGAFFSEGKTDGSFTRSFDTVVFEQSSFHLKNRDLAGFGEVAWPVSRALTVTPGLRVETARREMIRREYGPVPQVFSLQDESSAVLPKVGLTYALLRTEVFATVGAGYKPGGFSGFTGNPALAAFGPERTEAAEVGITRANAAKTATGTARVFYYDITGYQIERSFATGALADDYLVVNAPRARSFGSELELSRTLFEPWVVSLAVGVTEVELREFRDPFTNVDYRGNRAPYVPRYDASVRLAYGRPRGWFGDAEVNATGKTFYTEDEAPGFAQKAYALLRARVGYGTRRYRVAVFGDNLTDEGYYRSISPGTFHGTPGAPRTVGVEAGCTW